MNLNSINTTLSPYMNTTKSSGDESETKVIIGYACIGISVLFFGVFNLPVKHYKTGDGMFFQLMVGLGIWSVSLIVHCAQGFPEFHALPMLGGFFWSTANLQTVPTIKMLGLAISQTVNNLVSLIFGWAYARFGWFGIKDEIPTLEYINYAGVAICSISVIIYFFVEVQTDEHDDIERTAISGSKKNTSYNVTEPINSSEDRSNDLTFEENNEEWYDKLSEKNKKIVGISIATLGGIFFSLTFAPILYVQDNYEGASQNGNDYSLSLGSGILLSSMVYFIIYCLFKKNKPEVYPSLILPSLLTGWLWNIANTAYLLATTTLSQAVTFPISFSGPSIIASMLGLLLYKEITGRRNTLILFLGMTVTLAGIISCAISF